MKKIISIVLPCFNEEKNIPLIYDQIVYQFNLLNRQKKNLYDYEIIFIDNFSTDRSREIIRKICKIDKSVKAIFNSRNFGYIKSPYYGILNSSGQATILMCSDLQEPPALIPKFIRSWESGYKIVMAVKTKSDQSYFLNFLKSCYYKFLQKFSDSSPIPNTTGFGLYDKSVISLLKEINDPYPYLRGLVTMIGFPIKQINYDFAQRSFGLSKSNFSVLYDYMFLGIITHTRLPLRIIFLLGLFIFILSVILSLILIVFKFIYWNSIVMGYTPILVSILFFSGLQMLILGIIGEYISFMIYKTSKMPLVIESERLNFK